MDRYGSQYNTNRRRRAYRRNRGQRNKIKNANQRINNMEEEVKQIKKKVNVEPKGPLIAPIRNLNLKRYDYNQLYREYNQGIINYMQALLHPELCVSGEFSAKQPSFTPIPTTTVTFKEQFVFNPESDGTFKLYWNPNFFTTKDALRKHMKDIPTYGSNYEHFGYAHVFLLKSDGRLVCHTSYLPEIALTKYRLVSAKLRVEYNGSNLLKGGMISSCATYRDLPVIQRAATVQMGEDFSVGTSVVNSKLTSLVGLWDKENVNNGLWNKNVNISGPGFKLDNLAVPTDPTDSTFYPMDHYYGNEPQVIYSDQDVGVQAVSSTDGGHLSYVVLGSGLNTTNDQLAPINVFIYYNFEVIAAMETAPFLRSKEDPKGTKLLNLLEGKKVEISNIVKNENVKSFLSPSNTKTTVKNFAANLVREISKAAFNSLPSTSFWGNAKLPYKNFAY